MLFNKRFIGTLLIGLTLSSCETTNPQSNFVPNQPFSSLKAKKEPSPIVTAIIKLLKEDKYTEASHLINQALQSQPKSVVLHLLNGLTYEKLAERGDASGNELAAVGYQNAINLDPTNVFGITQLGKLKYREQIYDQAQEHFANALLLKPNDPDLWQELAAASYYAYDIKTALSAIDKAEKLKPNDPLIHRSATMIYAALGDFNTAKKHLEIFKNKAGEDPAVAHLTDRFNDWQTLYTSGRIRLAATSPAKTLNLPSPSSTGGNGSSGSGSSGNGSSGDGSSGSSGNGITSAETPYTIGTENAAEKVLNKPFGTSANANANVLNEPFPAAAEDSKQEMENAAKVSNPQIIVDCYLLRIQEDAITSKGQNILENLAVTLNPGGFSTFNGNLQGSGIAPVSTAVPTDSVVYTASNGFNPNQANIATTQGTGLGGAAAAFNPASAMFNLQNAGSFSGRVFAAGLTWAGLTYSLNIANAIDDRTEVVSRPSLITFLKKASVFFSGRELVAGFTGQYGGTLVKYPIGVTLEIVPQSLVDDTLTLEIGIEGSVLTAPNPNLAATTDVAKTRIDTFVKLRLGETLMLGGLYERQELSTKSGFPGLQDIPVVQYFFSNEQTLSTRTSIVFMLTPRSPDAVKAAVNRAMAREAAEPHLGELVSRTPDWFNTHSNLAAMFSYLAKDPIIYYEFRSNDILPPSWGWEPSISNKIMQLGSFLYF